MNKNLLFIKENREKVIRISVLFFIIFFISFLLSRGKVIGSPLVWLILLGYMWNSLKNKDFVEVKIMLWLFIIINACLGILTFFPLFALLFQ